MGHKENLIQINFSLKILNLLNNHNKLLKTQMEKNKFLKVILTVYQENNNNKINKNKKIIIIKIKKLFIPKYLLSHNNNFMIQNNLEMQIAKLLAII